MTIPFFDANPEIVHELRAMDHTAKAYKKYMQKTLLEIGGLGNLFQNLKASEEGERLRKKYFYSLTAMAACIIFVFIWAFLSVFLANGLDTEHPAGTDMILLAGSLVLDAAGIALTLFFSFRCQRTLLRGVSFLIDGYDFNAAAATGGNTLSSYKFGGAKQNTVAVVAGILIFFMVFGGIIAINRLVDLLPVQTQEFSKAGITITLTREFHEQEIVSQTAVFSSSKYIVMCLKEDFQSFEESGMSTDMPLKQYALSVIENNALHTNVEGDESRPFFVYSREANGKDYTYWATVFRGSGAYWMVTFACETKNFASSRKQFVQWADTVKVE